ncbi:hypothetical protein BC829DRAFT_182303 [Chytridium lagenaria]|nr:hypothetical protein BC829DRAFT_182303 [Chytridium lagenaria]
MQLGRLITILAILSATGVDARRKAVAVEPDAYGQPAAPVATTAVAPAMNSPVPVPDPAAYSAPAPVVAAPPPVVAAPPVDYTYAAPSQVVAAPSPMMASPSSEYTYAAPVPIVTPPVDYTYAAPIPIVAAPSPMMASPSSEYTYAAPIPIVAAPSSVMASPSPVAPPLAYTYAAPSQVVAAPSPPAAVYYTSPAPVLSSPSPIVEYTAPSVPVATSPVQMGDYAPTTTHVKKHKTKTVQAESSSSVGAVASDYGYGAPSPIATYVTPSQTTIYGTVYPTVTTTSNMHMAPRHPPSTRLSPPLYPPQLKSFTRRRKPKKHSKFTTQQPVATYSSSPVVSTNVSPDIILPPSPIYQAPHLLLCP